MQELSGPKLKTDFNFRIIGLNTEVRQVMLNDFLGALDVGRSAVSENLVGSAGLAAN
jgi:hypothetical protein